MIKLFLFIKKVTSSNGPTEFIKASHKTSKNFYLKKSFRNQTMTPENFWETLNDNNKRYFLFDWR